MPLYGSAERRQATRRALFIVIGPRALGENKTIYHKLQSFIVFVCFGFFFSSPDTRHGNALHVKRTLSVTHADDLQRSSTRHVLMTPKNSTFSQFEHFEWIAISFFLPLYNWWEIKIRFNAGIRNVRKERKRCLTPDPVNGELEIYQNACTANSNKNRRPMMNRRQIQIVHK